MSIFHVVAPGQYYLEQNLEARRRELEREEELEAKAPTGKAKSKCPRYSIVKRQTFSVSLVCKCICTH
jgi:hypothetical protein